MGKKACLKLDMGYDSWDDDNYHDEDEEIDIAELDNVCDSPNVRHDGAAYRTALKDADAAAELDGVNSLGSKFLESFVTDSRSTKQPRPIAKSNITKNNVVNKSVHQILPVITLKNTTNQQVLYVPNPLRLPLFTDHIATSDGLLVHVVLFLELSDVLNLSIVSKQLQTALSIDGLYCTPTNNKQDGNGILLPALWSFSERLLPLAPESGRPCRISQTFAHECIAFSKSSSKFDSGAIEPHKLLSINMPGRINAISSRRVRWKQSSIAVEGKGRSAPTQIFTWRSSIRLSYVTNEPDDCALMSIWDGEHVQSSVNISSSSASVTKKYPQERYLPPNTKHIIEATIHSESGLCAILAQPLEDESSCHYILSLVSLPTAPPGTARVKFGQNTTQDQCTLLWQRHISWNLFSSSETHPILAFSKQGKHIIFGSTERLGVAGIEKGGYIYEPLMSGLQTSTSTTINAYLMIHEFLFLLHNDGTCLRIYDVSNTSSFEPLAEGGLPWSDRLLERHKMAAAIPELHRSHEQRRQHLRNEYQLEFCGGKIWITGLFNFDLLCSSQPRLLRRLRTCITRSGVMPIHFTQTENIIFKPGSPKKMHVWNDTHLYVVDSHKLYFWRAPVHAPDKSISTPRTQMTTILSDGNYIESVYTDGSKIILATNCTFQNTTSRKCDRSGCVTVIPFDAYAQLDASRQLVYFSRPPTQRPNSLSKQKLELSNPRQYSALLKLYNKRYFNNLSFGEAITGANGHIPRHPISNGTNSNYQILEMFSEDGRYLLLQCKKGNSNKITIFDLYTCIE